MKTPLFAARLKELRERVISPGGSAISQSDLARAIGVTPQAVQKWEAGESVPREPKRRSIAGVLNTSVFELLRGTELEETAELSLDKVVNKGREFPLRGATLGVAKPENGAIPLISWEQAAAWGQKMDTFKPGDAQDWLRCPFEHGPHAFILEVAGESNYDPGGTKSYAPGELIYVDPAKTPTNRSMIVVRIDQEERAQLKQLLMDESDTRLLKSLNPNWPDRVRPMPEGAKIVGVVIGKWVPE